MATIEHQGVVKEMAEPYAGVLVKIGKAKYVTRQSVPEPPKADQEISPRTGKPKRQYKRRDMRAED